MNVTMIPMDLRGEMIARVVTPRGEVPGPLDDQGWNRWWLQAREQIGEKWQGGKEYTVTRIEDPADNGECILVIYEKDIPT